MHFNKIRKARYMGRNGKRNEQTCRWVQKENGELNVISPREKMKMRKSSGTGKGECL
jgi:hypothetical protein